MPVAVTAITACGKASVTVHRNIKEDTFNKNLLKVFESIGLVPIEIVLESSIE